MKTFREKYSLGKLGVFGAALLLLLGLLVASATNVSADAGDTIYISSQSSGTVGGVAFDDEDILAFDTTSATWSMFFDGSDVGLGAVASLDVDAFHIETDGSILLSVLDPGTLPDVGAIDDSDVVRFTPTSTGDATAGTYSLVLTGASYLLTTGAEDIDAITRANDGRLLLSTKGWMNAGGITSSDEDLVAVNATTLERYFDGSEIGLELNDEDSDAAWIGADDDIYLTTLSAFSAPPISGTGADVFKCTPLSSGPVASCNLTIEWTGASIGLGAQLIDGLHIGRAGGSTAPVAVDDEATTAEDQAVVVDLAGNDFDPNGDLDPSSADPGCGTCQTASNGMVTNIGDGTVSYQPNPAFVGVDTFEYEICDLTPECDIGLVTITVASSGSLPTPADDLAFTTELTPVTIDVAANDTDPDGDLDPTSVNVGCPTCTSAANGVTTANPSGTITYTPTAGFSGTDTFDYEICDLVGGCATASVDVVVSFTATLVNTIDGSAWNPPSTDTHGVVYLFDQDRLLVTDAGVDQSVFFGGKNLYFSSLGGILEDSAVSTSYYGPQLEPTGITVNPANGHLFISQDFGARGVFEIDAGLDGDYFTPDDVVTSFLTSAFGSTDPEGVTFDPVSGHLFVAEGKDSTIFEVSPGVDGLFNGIPPMGDDVVVSQFLTEPLGVEDPEGIALNPYTGNLYLGGRTNTIGNDTFDTIVEVTTAGNLVGTIDVSAVNPTGSLPQKLSGLGIGPSSIDPNARVLYIADRGQHIDSNANQNDGRIFEVTIPPLPPSAPESRDDEAITPVNTAIDIDVSANDSDPNDNLDPTTTNTTCGTCTSPTNGSLTNLGNGTITYTPNTSYLGTNTFTYEICDTTALCDTATATITVTGANVAPDAVDDGPISTPQNTPIDIDVSANDSDPNNNLDPTTTNTTCGTCSGPANGSLTNLGNGTITYTPNTSYTGSDSFTYEICDTLAACDTATVTIDVTAGLNPPIAVDDQASTQVDTVVDVNVSANDTDPNNNLDPTTTTTTCGTCSGPANGSITNLGNGTISYSPNTSFTGSDSFTYEICDTTALCDTATATITVTGAKSIYVTSTSGGNIDGLVFRDEDIIIFDETTSTWATYFDGSDVGLGALGGQDIEAFHLNGDGSILISVARDDTLPDVGLIGDEDILRFVPTSTGSTTAGTWEMFLDGSANLLTTSSEDIDAIGYAPDGRLLISTRGSFNVGTVVGQDRDILAFDQGVWELYFDGSALELELVDEDINGLFVDASGKLFLTTAMEYTTTGTSGTRADIFTCTPSAPGPVSACVYDSFWVPAISAPGFAGENINGLFLTDSFVAPQPPNAVPDTASTQVDTVVDVNVSANDTDPNNNLDPTTTTTTCGTCSGPANGSITNLGNGTISYSPNTSFTGSDSFTYEICDTTALCDTATATITVTATPEASTTYLSSTSGGSVGGISFADEDILAFDEATSTWSIFFDGSDVGLGAVAGQDVGAFHLNADGSILLSLGSSDSLAGVGAVQDHDVLRFVPTSTGDTTAGTWELFFNGEDHGLTTGAEDIDAIAFAPDGRLLISTKGYYNTGTLSGPDEDILGFNNGTWSRYFDGSAEGFADISEDINGIRFNSLGQLELTTVGAFSVAGLSGTSADSITCDAPTTGASVSGCGFTLGWDSANATHDLGNENLNALGIGD